MKKNLLNLLFFFAYIFSVHAQTLYGLTHYGGDDGGGALIKFIPATNNLTVPKSFESPAGFPTYTDLIQASDGKLYGMTTSGGNSHYSDGVIFSYDPSSFTYTKMKDFDGTNGGSPCGSLLQASDGKLYGMAGSVIFSFDPPSSTYTKLKNFDGVNGTNPYGSLVQASNGKLYGMTRQGGSSDAGVIFSFDPSSSTYTKLKDFDFTNGALPYGDLMQATNGKLYGMTQYGGSNGQGVIFSFDPLSSTYIKLKDFDGINGGQPFGSLMQASNGKLYGMAGSVIFSFDLLSSTYTKLKDFNCINGCSPYGRLLQASNGKLYGMTRHGGSGDYGVIFSFDPVSSVYTKLKDFDKMNGANPMSSLMQASNGKLYGLTNYGGVSPFSDGGGVIFSFDLSSSIYTKLKDFNVVDGSHPTGSPIQASDGKLYGMTINGGSNALGFIFSFDPSSSTYTKLKDFNVTDGAWLSGTYGYGPYGSLMQASDGKLYGMAGAIFSFDPVSFTYTKVKDLAGTDGYAPRGRLVQAKDGKLYGMTSGGGSNAVGVIFSFDPNTLIYAKLFDFAIFDSQLGGYPMGSLVQAENGKLYGMTYNGGYGPGSLFSFDPVSSTYARLIDIDGANPFGSLILASDGKLYGSGGSNIFSFDPSTSTYKNLKDFFDINGINDGPPGDLMQASDGKIYGKTYNGGSNGGGVIFSYDPSSSTYTKLKDFDWTNGPNPYFGSAFIEIHNGTLPVTLIGFTGKNIGSNNQLTWKVENEQDLNYYELQRGIDGRHFTGIAQIKAAGNNNYTYDDPIAAEVSSVYYYRLKSVDRDGSFKYSSICAIRFNATNTGISIFPNPAVKSICIQTVNGDPLAANSKTTISIYSSSMQLLQSKSISKADGNAVNIPVEKLASGMYYLQLVNGVDKSVLKFVKE